MASTIVAPRLVNERVGAVDEVLSVTLETDEGVDWHTEMMTEEAQRQRKKRKAARKEEYFDDTTEEASAND
ncbi:hypothetical protein [Haloterrigena alkaliphila]|uniref:hypothetical protein n=1 Tax=Haloterrigena alkaliphila TaxID=2816475 RepID=UPI001CFF7A4D|nr:hypothetical protein [Haloterrigena alkaliphila]UHQ95202.1 hypothetical protein J0X25_19060 [Haloterrigena alkaliphila]